MLDSSEWLTTGALLCLLCGCGDGGGDTPDGAAAASSGGAAATGGSGSGATGGGPGGETGGAAGEWTPPQAAGCTVTSGPCDPVVIAEGQLSPGAFEITPTHLYWRGGDEGQSLLRVAHGMDAAETIIESVSQLTGVAVDDTFAYVTTGVSDPGLGRYRLDGTAALEPLETAANQPWDIERAGNVLYYGDAELDGGVYALDIATGASVRVVAAARVVAVAPYGPYVYFTAGPTTTITSAVFRVPLAGGAVEQLTTEGEPGELTLAGGFVYWGQYGGICRVPIDGGAVELIVPTGEATVETVTPDSTHIYWTQNDGLTAQVMRAALDGSGAEIVADGTGEYLSVAVTDTLLYFSNRDPTNPQVLRVAKCGCP